MAKGKYAARAANARAESASERADRLEAALADERAASAREIGALKAQVQQLSGQLTTAARDMAAVEIERIRADAAERVEAQRADFKRRGIEAMRYLSQKRILVSWEENAELHDLLDLDGRAVGQMFREEGHLNRDQARSARKDLRARANHAQVEGATERVAAAMRERTGGP